MTAQVKPYPLYPPRAAHAPAWRMGTPDYIDEDSPAYNLGDGSKLGRFRGMADILLWQTGAAIRGDKQAGKAWAQQVFISDGSTFANFIPGSGLTEEKFAAMVKKFEAKTGGALTISATDYFADVAERMHGLKEETPRSTSQTN